MRQVGYEQIAKTAFANGDKGIHAIHSRTQTLTHSHTPKHPFEDESEGLHLCITEVSGLHYNFL